MEKYLIAVDMDGTLLDSRNQISDYTMNVLQKIQNMGHYLVPASGRCVSLLPPKVRSLENLSYAAAENGAYIWDFQKKVPLYQKILPKAELQEILKEALLLPCFVEMFAEGIAYTEWRQLLKLKDTVQSENFIHYLFKDHIYVERLENMPEIFGDVSKINLYFEEAEAGRRFREKWEKREALTITSSVGDNVEISSAGVSKGAAIQFLMEKLHIPRERVLVFGDNENDLEMFKAAGCAVAMANAAEKIRWNADYVTLDCDHDGVAVFLEQYFKEEKTDGTYSGEFCIRGFEKTGVGAGDSAGGKGRAAL